MKTEVSLKGRSLLRLDDLSDEEMIYLIDLAEDFKHKKKMGIRGNTLRRKNIALIFEKHSTRTRCAFTVAARDEGGQSEYLGTHDIHFGKKESIADTARVLGRMFDGIAFRGFKQKTVEQLAKYSGIPVWNGLTDEWHPTQILADLLTIRENFGRLKGLKVVYIGDGRNNVANTLMIGCAKAGMHFVDCAPAELAPPADLCREVALMAASRGGSVTVTTNPIEAVQGANVVYSDVWVSMGEEAKFAERLNLLRPYQITMDLMRHTGNFESGQVIFLHCLPAFHDFETEVTKDIGPMEVTDEVFEATFSKVFDEAENRVHTIKAVMVASLA
ncbi:MAG: ornithine carbamoyltransferase [bacterium]